MTNPNEMIKYHLTPVFNNQESAKILDAIGGWPEMCDSILNAVFENNRQKALHILGEIGFSL